MFNKKGYRIKKYGLIEFTTFPNAKQTKKIGNYVKEYNLALTNRYFAKVVSESKINTEISKDRYRELEKEAIEEVKFLNLEMTKKILILLTNVKKEDLTTEFYIRYDSELTEITNEINKMIQPMVKEYNKILQKNFKKIMETR